MMACPPHPRREGWFAVLLVAFLPVSVAIDGLLRQVGIPDGFILVHASALLLGLVALGPGLRWPDHPAPRLFVLAALLALAWMLLGQLVFPSWSQTGWLWLAGHAVALLAFLRIASAGRSLAWLIPAFGAGAAAALALTLFAQRCGIGDNTLAFGNGNSLINACCPAIIGWVAWELCARRKNLPALAASLGAVGILLLSAWTLFPDLPRRGVLVATGIAAAWLGLAWIRRRWPALHRPLLLLACLAAAGVLVAGAWWVAEDPGLGRNQRVLYLRAAIQALPEALPFGLGPGASVGLAGAGVEAARELAAQGNLVYHSHCEPLDTLLIGGAPLAALALMGAAAMAWSLIIGRSMRVATALQSAIIALTIHLLTDPVASYEGPLFVYGGCLGLVARQSLARVVFPKIASPPLWLLRPVGLLLLAVGIREASTCHAATAQDPLKALKRTLRPDAAVVAFRAIEGLPLRADLASNALHELNRVAAGSGVDLDLRMELARAEGDRGAEFSAQLQQLRIRPTWLLGYRRLIGLLQRDKSLLRLLPADIAGRIPYIAGDPRLPMPSVELPVADSLDRAADLVAKLHWAIVCGHQDQAERLLHLVVFRYGHLPDVAALAWLAQASRTGAPIQWAAQERFRLRSAFACSDAGLLAEQARLLDSAGRGSQSLAFLRDLFPEGLPACEWAGRIRLP